MDVKQQELSKVVEKDLDFVFTLMALNEGTDRDEQIWGALIKRSYDKQVIRRLYVRTLFRLLKACYQTSGRGTFRGLEIHFARADVACRIKL
jgi:hypothetical protein